MTTIETEVPGKVKSFVDYANEWGLLLESAGNVSSLRDGVLLRWSVRLHEYSDSVLLLYWTPGKTQYGRLHISLFDPYQRGRSIRPMTRRDAWGWLHGARDTAIIGNLTRNWEGFQTKLNQLPTKVLYAYEVWLAYVRQVSPEQIEQIGSKLRAEIDRRGKGPQPGQVWFFRRDRHARPIEVRIVSELPGYDPADFVIVENDRSDPKPYPAKRDQLSPHM